MTLPRLPDYLDHMRQAIADAQSFTDGMAQADFVQDKRTQQAVVMSLIVLGEAATKVMDQHPAFAEQHTQIPWRNRACVTASPMATSISTLTWYGIPSRPHCLF
jgi:uncharacterized protein with HEPN domain